MSSEMLERRFAAVGARLKVAEGPWRGEPRIDIRADARGEYFDLRFARGEQAVDLEVVDTRPRDRHLLLLARAAGEKSKFLCGHDERHWFVAAVPEAARGVTGVATAKAALQPPAVRELVERTRPKDPFRRRNAAYVRQGELVAAGPRPRGVRQGDGPPSGPRDDPPRGLAPRPDEHRAGRAGDAARRLHRLTGGGRRVAPAAAPPMWP